MVWSGSSLISEFSFATSGAVAGILIDGYLKVTLGTIYPSGAGPILTDQLGNFWQLGVTNVDGDAVLTTTQVYPG